MTSKEELEQFIKKYEETKIVVQPNLIDILKDAVKELEELETLKEYKELEEQGQLIKLPCAVGNKIYTVNFPYISTDEIEKISVNYETRTELIKESQIGTYAFLSRKEAEAFLNQIKEWLENKK